MNNKDILKIFTIISLLFVSAGISTIVSNDIIPDQEESYTLDTGALGALIDIEISNDIAVKTQGTLSLPIYKVLSEDKKQKIETDWSKQQNNIPSEDEAFDIAKSYIISNGGLPKDAVLARVEKQYLVKSSYITGEDLEKYPLGTDIYYKREINGMEVVGREDYIYVSIGENGKILCYLKTWRNLEKIGDINTISYDDALIKLQNGKILERPISPYLEPLTINQAALGYYYSEDTEQCYKPVWVFKATDSINGTIHLLVDAQII